MSAGTSGADLGVYVHVPFCEHVCPYCDFAVVAVGRLAGADEDDLVSGLLEEWRRWRGEVAGRRVASVYFGGGTPSLLRPKSLGRLLEALAADLALQGAEITVELNPGQLEVSRVPELRALGVTRLSVGLQSTDGEILRRLGRAQRADEALGGLETCLAAGFESLSADLIYAAPGQTVAGLLRDVERVIALGVPHVSAYALTLEPETPFARAASAGRLELPDEDTVVEMSRLLRARLGAAGIAQYEISSYARPGHRSRHNQRYWTRSDVLGIGPSAASLFGERRLRNARSLADWRAALGAPRGALSGPAPPRRRAPRCVPAPLRRSSRGLARARARAPARARAAGRRVRLDPPLRARPPVRGRGVPGAPRTLTPADARG